MYCYHKEEKGVALVTALLMMVISLAIAVAVLYLITRGTTVSSLTRQYHTAHEAAFGGAEFSTKEIVARVIAGTQLSALGNYNNSFFPNVTDACFNNKLLLATADWGCSSSSLDVANTSDFRITLQGTASKANFDVFVKIVSTVPGNSNLSGNDLDSGNAVASGSSSGVTSPPSMPYKHQIEIQAQRSASPDERANLTGLYLY